MIAYIQDVLDLPTSWKRVVCPHCCTGQVPWQTGTLSNVHRTRSSQCNRQRKRQLRKERGRNPPLSKTAQRAIPPSIAMQLMWKCRQCETSSALTSLFRTRRYTTTRRKRKAVETFITSSSNAFGFTAASVIDQRKPLEKTKKKKKTVPNSLHSFLSSIQ